MDANHIIVIKDRQEGVPMVFTLGEAITLYDGLNNQVVILDHDNKLGHCIRESVNAYVTPGKNDMEILSFPYDTVVSIKSYNSKEQINSFLDKLIVDGVIVEENKQDILDVIYKIGK